MRPPRILLVEDNIAIASSLAQALIMNGFETIKVYRAIDALRQLQRPDALPDLIVIDVLLPDIDGFELSRLIRSGLEQKDVHTRLLIAEIPIIMLTALNTKEDILKGLHSGADHYLTKPIDPEVLSAHINIQLNRKHRRQQVHIEYGRAKLFPDVNMLVFVQTPVQLSPQECALLQLFLSHPEITLSREEILQIAWNITEKIETKTVDVHIYKLRRKLRKITTEEPFITVRGKGYKLNSGCWR